MSDGALWDNYILIPPFQVQSRWERFQIKPVLEGVWANVADEDLRREV